MIQLDFVSLALEGMLDTSTRPRVNDNIYGALNIIKLLNAQIQYITDSIECPEKENILHQSWLIQKRILEPPPF